MRTKSFADVYNQWGRIQQYAGRRYDNNKFFKLLDTWVLYKDNICRHFYGVSHGYMFGRMNDMQSLANKKVSREIYAGYMTMKQKKEWWEGWYYRVCENHQGSFEGCDSSNKRDAIRMAKFLSKLYPNADVYVYRYYKDKKWAHTQQTTVWANDNFIRDYGG